MLQDPSKITDTIVNWLKQYVASNYKKTLIVGVSGGLDSTVTALLCLRTGISTELYHQVCSIQPDFSIFKSDYTVWTDKLDNDLNYSYAKVFGRLGSIAEKYNGLVVGSVSRTKGKLARFYNKRGDGSADIFPLRDLYKSELYELYKYLTGVEFTGLSVIELYPELHPELLTHESKLNLLYSDIEWADKENQKNSIIENNDPPNLYTYWYKYFLKQKEVLFRLHQYEKRTRHKSIDDKPICQLRHLTGSII